LHHHQLGLHPLLLRLLLQGGELELSLLLGDPAAALGLSGSLGSVLLPEAATGGAAPKPKLLTAGFQPVNNLKPNIAHIFVSGSAWTGTSESISSAVQHVCWCAGRLVSSLLSACTATRCMHSSSSSSSSRFECECMQQIGSFCAGSSTKTALLSWLPAVTAACLVPQHHTHPELRACAAICSAPLTSAPLLW
jgi:hypothetical protein